MTKQKPTKPRGNPNKIKYKKNSKSDLFVFFFLIIYFYFDIRYYLFLKNNCGWKRDVNINVIER